MISRVFIRGDLKDGPYAEFKSGDSLYFYPSKNSSTLISYGERLKIRSRDYEVEFKGDVNFSTISFTSTYSYTSLTTPLPSPTSSPLPSPTSSPLPSPTSSPLPLVTSPTTPTSLTTSLPYFNNPVTVHFTYSNSSHIFDKFSEIKICSLKNYLLVLIYKMIFYKFYFFILVDIPLLSLDFIRNQPIGIKQNTIINEFLGNICRMFITQSVNINMGANKISSGMGSYKISSGMGSYKTSKEMSSYIHFFNYYLYYVPYLYTPHLYTSHLFYFLNREKLFLKLSITVISLLYKTVVDRIVDVMFLFNNKTYNTLKKRYDTISLSLDQILMCVLFFSISILILPSLLIYYLVHIVFKVCIGLLETLELGLMLLFVDCKNTFYFDKTNCEFMKTNKMKNKMKKIVEYVIWKKSDSVMGILKRVIVGKL